VSPGTGPQRGAAYDPEASLRTETSVGKIQKLRSFSRFFLFIKTAWEDARTGMPKFSESPFLPSLNDSVWSLICWAPRGRPLIS
jgi:hypothetical protein